MFVKGRYKEFTSLFLVVGTSPSFILVKSHGVVMFSEMRGFFMKYVTNVFCVLMIDICTNYSESHMVGFIVGILCKSAYGCIFVCIVL